MTRLKYKTSLAGHHTNFQDEASYVSSGLLCTGKHHLNFPTTPSIHSSFTVGISLSSPQTLTMVCHHLTEAERIWFDRQEPYFLDSPSLLPIIYRDGYLSYPCEAPFLKSLTNLRDSYRFYPPPSSRASRWPSTCRATSSRRFSEASAIPEDMKLKPKDPACSLLSSARPF